MATSVVIDTNVLTFAVGGHGDEDRTAACTELIFKIVNDDGLAFALDTDGEILDEYKENISEYKTPHTRLLQTYFEKQLKSRDGVSFHLPIHESEVSDLKEMGFHEKDLIFVRLAPRTESECIASCDGESLMNNDFKEWIENELDISVYFPKDIIENDTITD